MFTTNFSKYIALRVIYKTFEPIAIFHVHSEAAKTNVKLHPGLWKRVLWGVLHVKSSHILLHLCKVFLLKGLDTVKLIELPQLDILIFVQSQCESFVIHHMFVNHARVTLDSNNVAVLYHSSLILFASSAVSSLECIPLHSVRVWHLEAINGRTGVTKPNEAVLVVNTKTIYWLVALVDFCIFTRQAVHLADVTITTCCDHSLPIAVFPA